MQHYVGSPATCPSAYEPTGSEGCVTTRRAFDQRIGFTLARVWWPGTLRLERQIKAGILGPGERDGVVVPVIDERADRADEDLDRGEGAAADGPPGDDRKQADQVPVARSVRSA